MSIRLTRLSEEQQAHRLLEQYEAVKLAAKEDQRQQQRQNGIGGAEGRLSPAAHYAAMVDLWNLTYGTNGQGDDYLSDTRCRRRNALKKMGWTGR